MPNWPEPWLRNVGGTLPPCYVAFDIESSGFSYSDPILSIAHCQVRDGKIEHSLNAYIDWRRTPGVDLSRLRQSIDKVSRELPGYNITWDLLCERGHPPEKVLGGYYDIFRALIKRGYYAVGHNAYRFDEPRLSQAMKKFNLNFDFGDRLIDTQVMEVASRVSDAPALRYEQDDTLRTWSKRVINHSSKFTGCKLMEHLVPKYGFVLDFDRTHDADIGAIAVHYLTEHFRKVIQHRKEPLHPTQWLLDKEKSTETNVPDSGLHPMPVNKPIKVNTSGLKRFRGQRAN